MNLADLAAVAATVLAVGVLWPQLRRLRRTGDAAGVSLAWTLLGAVTNTAWAVYLTHQRLWLAVPSTVAMVVFYALLAITLARSGAARSAGQWAAVAWTVILALTLALGGWTALGLVLGVAYGVQVTPSVWTAYRTAVPSGIAPGTWWMSGAEVTLWGAYGLAHRDLGIAVFAVTGILAAALMLARFYATRGRFLPA